MKIIYLLIILIQLIIYSTINSFSTAKIAIIIVIDQFGHNYINKLESNLNYGIKYLLDNGIIFTNAHYAQSPCTSADHALLSTGVFASYHGIINNKWYENNQLVYCDQDNSNKAKVFKPDGTLYDYGKSAKNIMVDGLSDQLIINSNNFKDQVWSLSLKSRAAISMASKLGKALWLDNETGNFTSSRAYFDKFPEWITNFNKKEKIDKIINFIWKPTYKDKQFYNIRFNNYYKYSKIEFPLIDNILTVDNLIKDKYEQLYNKTPLANQNLINLAKKCIKINLNNNKFILWLSLSSLDKVGHVYGPDSKEAVDMVYQMDNQIQDLINYVHKIADKKNIKKEEVLIALTADHGVMPITPPLKEFGLDIVHNYSSKELTDNINSKINNKYNIKDIIIGHKNNQFYLNKLKLKKLKKNIRANIYKDIKKYLLSLPGIRNAWTFKELSKANFDILDRDIYIRREIYKKRSGKIFYSLMPYTKITKHYLKGIAHTSQYNYDTHVPLIIYQPNNFFKKRITKNVYMTQFAPTISQILNIPRPSASSDKVLPIFDK